MQQEALGAQQGPDDEAPDSTKEAELVSAVWAGSSELMWQHLAEQERVWAGAQVCWACDSMLCTAATPKLAQHVCTQ